MPMNRDLAILRGFSLFRSTLIPIYMNQAKSRCEDCRHQRSMSTQAWDRKKKLLVESHTITYQSAFSGVLRLERPL